MKFRSPFHCKWKGERWDFRKQYCFWGFICVWIFFVSFLLFLLSQKKKQEKPDGKRKKKKGFLGHACRLIKFPCVKRGEFYLLSCVTCGHSTSANSAGPNYSLRIRWFVEMVSSGCLLASQTVALKNNGVQPSFFILFKTNRLWSIPFLKVLGVKGGFFKSFYQ